MTMEGNADPRRDVARLRLRAHGIDGGTLRGPRAVVEHLGAVQAQDYVQSLWAIGLRTPGASVADVEQAVEQREIVRTWGMRGTLHWGPAKDAEWMRSLFAPRILARTTAKEWAYHGADQRSADRAAGVLEEALCNGTPQRRDDLSIRLKDAGVSDDRQQHYFLYAHLSHSGLLVHGPRRDGKDTFALRSAWLPEQRTLSPEDGAAVLAERFFTSHGPATLADFANWSGLPKRDARNGLEQASGRLVRDQWGDTEHWLAPDVAEGSGTHLLPGFDELLVGYAERGHHFRTHGEIPISTYNGMFFATVVVDGQVAGTWKRAQQKKLLRVDARVEPAVDREELAAAAGRVAEFHDRSLRLEVGPPPDRPRAGATSGRPL